MVDHRVRRTREALQEPVGQRLQPKRVLISPEIRRREQVQREFATSVKEPPAEFAVHDSQTVVLELIARPEHAGRTRRGDRVTR
jgi:hypothetical protein